MAEEAWTMRIDGASRGNPGDAAYAVVIERPGLPVYEEAECLGRTTNNVAEYTALLRGLDRAAQLGARRLNVFSDSELLVKQMNGEYRVKNDDLKALHAAASQRLNSFERVVIKHVRREQNKRADELCNAALDGQPLRLEPTAEMPAPPVLREQVLNCLRRAAKSWAQGDASKPTPEAVWAEIWALLTASVG